MTTSNVMENSNTPAQTQDPPATEPTEAMVEAAARAMCAADGDLCDALDDWRYLARVALIAGIAAALEKGR